MIYRLIQQLKAPFPDYIDLHQQFAWFALLGLLIAVFF